jgi:hypothetical protein
VKRLLKVPSDERHARLAPNGVAALRIVGADEAVAAIATPIRQMAMAVGRKRIDLPGLADVPPLRVVHRSDLYRVLHDRAVAGGVARSPPARRGSTRPRPRAPWPGC